MNMTPEKEVVKALDYKWDLLTWVFSITLFCRVLGEGQGQQIEVIMICLGSLICMGWRGLSWLY